ncbi:tetratricopeptide repeat protein [Roseateles amylovorans]|uniref:Tetratricopeptide repeat protein n=1 Tax=Roseateles amylovorans TaxID=2978473 RepID=A0ABY6B434_9BURK|nr:tetratricopeptide repeat protein [Roseateles amylovorans]UXH80133.1 tetratricopeptide repeat protein [Roseateles amylovorans]
MTKPSGISSGLDRGEPRLTGLRRAVGAIALLVAALGPWLSQPAQAAIFKDADIQSLLDAGQADDLEKLASQRLKSQPEDAQAIAALALAQLDLADPAALRQNIQRLEQCVERHPQEASCSYALALAQVMQVRSGSKFKALGALGKVSDLMQKTMTLLPDAPEPRSAMQQYYLALPSFIGGGESKARALEQGLQDPDQVHLLRARVAASKKDWSTMERELRAVRTQRPELLLELRLSWSDLGRQWMHNGQHAKAQAWYEELIKNQPQQAMGWYGLGRVLDAMGQYDRAVTAFERAKGLRGAEQLALDQRQGIALQSKGDKAGARAAFERAIAHRRASASSVEDCKRRLAELGAAT